MVKEAGGSSNYPINNYEQWAVMMRIKLQARGLWDAIKHGTVDYVEDRMALEAMCSGILPEMYTIVWNKKTAKMAWDCFTMMRIGDERIRKSSA